MNLLKSTIGRKQLVGVAGLLLAGFVLTHMLGNMLLFVGPQAYNEYSHKLTSNPLIYVAEAGLVLFFFAHAFVALALQLRNWASRDTRYAVIPNGEKRTSMVKRSLWFQGIVIFVFAVLHLLTFKFGTLYSVNYGEGDIRDIHRLVLEVFQSPGYVVWYIISLILLGLHLGPGVASSFQTLGFNHPKYTPKIKAGSIAFAWLVTIGFIIQPIYVYLMA